jgi:hypothetical protein
MCGQKLAPGVQGEEEAGESVKLLELRCTELQDSKGGAPKNGVKFSCVQKEPTSPGKGSKVLSAPASKFWPCLRWERMLL